MSLSEDQFLELVVAMRSAAEVGRVEQTLRHIMREVGVVVREDPSRPIKPEPIVDMSGL